MDELQSKCIFVIWRAGYTNKQGMQGAKWIAGPYHLGENLLGPEGYICLLQKLQQIPLGNRL